MATRKNKNQKDGQFTKTGSRNEDGKKGNDEHMGPIRGTDYDGSHTTGAHAPPSPPTAGEGNESQSALAAISKTMEMIALLLDRQTTASGTTAAHDVASRPLQITTMPDLTSTMPLYSGQDTENFKEWKDTLKSAQDRCSWSDEATLSAAISRLRGRAAAWHRTEGSKILTWPEWITALQKEFDQPHHESTPKRLCVDYRFLNAKTVKRAYPMPRVDTLLRRITGSRYLSKLDVKKAFLNIRLREEDIEKAAFVTEDGHYEPLRMLFGLCTAPSTMQSVMNEGLKTIIDDGHVIVYMDDVCVFTDTIEMHMTVLDQVLKSLRDLGLRVDFKKCMFAEPTIPFLGFLVSREGVAVDPQRTAALSDYGIPRSKTDVRSFLGLASHYRKYIKDFAKIARPLTLLTKKDAIVQWTPECQTAMDTLKQRLTEAPVLANFDPSLPTQVYVDASYVAFGAVLVQVHGNSTRVVEYASKKVTDADGRNPPHIKI